MSKEIVPVESAPVGQVESFITKAIEMNLDIDKMKEFLAMRKEAKQDWAKEQYDIAMARFQEECPVIKKNKSVQDKSGVKRYSYSPLDSIVQQVGKLIAKNGFSYTTKIKNDKEFLTATVRVTHRAGHSEESEFAIPVGTEAFMTDVQKYGARATFAKRYAFINAFGILTGDEDTDAKGKKEKENFNISPYEASIAETTTDAEFKEVWNKLPAQAKVELREFAAKHRKTIQNEDAKV